MDSVNSEVSREVPPYLRVYRDGTIERLAGTEVVPPNYDPHQTGVASKDTVVVPETGVSARLYRPTPEPGSQKLPLVVYFHGGAFCISSVSDPYYHNSLNFLVAESHAILLSVNYRLAPEHPLPAAYDHSWAALHWVSSHIAGAGAEPWLNDDVDFDRVFLAGDSAGANIAHHMAIRAGSDQIGGLKLRGVIMIHPYFWGETPIGSEITDPTRKAMVDCWWGVVCPSERGNNDPFINPFVDGAPSLSDLGCDRVIVCVAEKDVLRERGRHYYERLVKSGWEGKVEVLETEGEDHVFHIFNPGCEKAMSLMNRLGFFINQD